MSGTLWKMLRCRQTIVDGAWVPDLDVDETMIARVIPEGERTDAPPLKKGEAYKYSRWVMKEAIDE